jgi:hypothetical protein
MAYVTPTYSVNALVDNLAKITENGVACSPDNINNPTPTFVQTIIFELLKQIGFSRL